MALTSDTLAVLAKKNMAVGPVKSTYTATPAYTGTYPISGNGIDVENAIWALVEVMPSGGDCEFELVERQLDNSTFIKVNNGSSGLTSAQDKGWSEMVRVAALAELYVVVTAGTATSVVVNISPCLG